MKTICLAAILCLSQAVFSQQSNPAQPKGATPVRTPSLAGITRALVIGISDYQDAGIPDLRFAHTDAAEFVAYLKSRGGGGLKDEQILLLTNQQATTAQIYGGLDWLLEACGPDDQVAIYFSGHGDVETKTVRQQGFLLAYDTPKTNYMIGAVRLNDLNGYLESIVQEKKARVVVITDACHSGNLAGGRDGALATATALSSQFQNQIKIMSCQPNELSLESEQWGGGRGVFSYYLIDGLTGLADENADNAVTLVELDRYLSNTVPAQTDQQQFPFTSGMKAARLVGVDAQALVDLREKRKLPGDMAPVAPKGLIEDLVARADSSVGELYDAFLAAVDERYFLPSDLREGRQPGRSASELFDRLSGEASLRTALPLMRRNFAVALQSESQQAINAYLRADQAELAARWNLEIDRYKTNPVYLAKAASLLGEKHVLHDQLVAKQFYFEGLIKRLEGGRMDDTVLLNEALALELKAIGLDSGAAYVFNEIGLIYDEIRLIYKAKEDEVRNQFYSKKQLDAYAVAMGLAPKWVMPVLNTANTFFEIRRYKDAGEFALKTIELDSNLIVPQLKLLCYTYYFTGQYEQAVSTNESLLAYYPEEALYYYNLACLESLLKHQSQAIGWLEKAIQLGYAFETIQSDKDLDNIRGTESFKVLIRAYFPDKKN